jgi:hypothetical protein
MGGEYSKERLTRLIPLPNNQPSFQGQFFHSMQDFKHTRLVCGNLNLSIQKTKTGTLWEPVPVLSRHAHPFDVAVWDTLVPLKLKCPPGVHAAKSAPRLLNYSAVFLPPRCLYSLARAGESVNGP